MFGRLKSLFKRRPGEEQFAEAPPEAPQQEFKPPRSPAPRPQAPPAARSPFAPTARASPAPQTSSPDVAEETPQAAGGDSLQLSLKPILLTLPDNLKAK